jgi:hypothetical protein
MSVDTWMKSPGVLIGGNISFNSTATVTGAGSAFLSTFLPGDIIAWFIAGAAGNKYYSRVLSITNDTSLVLTAHAPNTRLNIPAYLVPRTVEIKGDSGRLYDLAPPAVGETPDNSWTGTLPIPADAVVAAGNIGTTPGGLNVNWVAGSAPPAPPAPPVIPAGPTLMTPPIGEELDTFTVLGQTDGHEYIVTAYLAAPLTYRQTVPAQAVNPLIADGWTIS